MAEAESEVSRTRIMVAVNESSMKGYPHASISSEGAFQWTLEKIVHYNPNGFKILLLHVQFPPGDGFNEMNRVYTSPSDFQVMKNRNKARGLHLLEYFILRCHQFGVPCEAWIKRGDPKQVILFEARRVQPDILVLGCRGLRTFERIEFGSVSEFCRTHPECPTMVITRKDEDMPPNRVDD
ncbi:hypothetical protein GIB67_004333 [Kingdonia uniflora]|uniref:UspA domain-containing protein n=1 Tax=Kingdonia uniflora TaxID=39325 RepID=A0A7J7MR55_9MAGN|nr:hypothetical protein GIB67_004333 [Kingdonia uniflora]